MSKSAIKTINAALTIINKAGVNMPHLVNSITDKDFRKNWRNADDLASFIVTCLADCFEAETLESIKDHEWSDMAYACQMYFEGGCDLWNGKQWRETLHTDALIELARLSTLVDRWVEYHAKLARAATDYEMVKQARFEAANSFGGVIGEQEELEEKLNAKGHYAAALLVEENKELKRKLEAAERERDNWRTSFDNERFRADKLAEAFKTEHEQLLMANSALITQHMRANEAESRIAELDGRDKSRMMDALHVAVALNSAGISLNDFDECVLRLHEWGALPDYCIALYVDFIHGCVSENKLLDFGYVNDNGAFAFRQAEKRIAELERSRTRT